ncbi:MAG: C_GCAxxG_C_C family protein [Deltaproteobacteria bacterium]|nr:C_GCAxxG_C_C family protein [Deltaproteobacteria bacterium]
MILGLRDHGLIHCTDDLLRAATGFAGGIGRSYQGLCGALSAGVMALGCLYGRAVFLVETSPCAKRVKRLMERFNETRRSNICKDLTAEFGPPDSESFKSKERKTLCADIVRDTGNMVAEVALWKTPTDK